MQPAPTPSSTSSSSSGSETPSLPDVFCGLGSLIVEGRLPTENSSRGYTEGPHVGSNSALGAARHHECSEINRMCKKDENFRKHMVLLWQNNVPVCIEVLLCSDCRLGKQKARSVEFSTIPEPGSILLEQWTVAVHQKGVRPGEKSMSSRGLFQAVRSYLAFSQLSAWLSSSRGTRPQNILYRITIPGEAFNSKFPASTVPDVHEFPLAAVGPSSCVGVSVRSYPRSQDIPKVLCTHSDLNPVPSSLNIGALSPSSPSPGVSPTGSSSPDSSPNSEENKLAMAGALSWKDAQAGGGVSSGSNADLRRALVRSKIESAAVAAAAAAAAGGGGSSGASGACQLPRSDSMDSMLGDSLLDPPQSLQKMPPKRYQSPSRCGSPSLEAPEHLLFGATKEMVAAAARGGASRKKPQSPSPMPVPAERCARQDSMRRRDRGGQAAAAAAQYLGIHPRRLMGLGIGFGPQPSASPLDDRMQVECNISGKHICASEDDDRAHCGQQAKRAGVDSAEEDEDEDQRRHQKGRLRDNNGWIYEYLTEKRKQDARYHSALPPAHFQSQQNPNADSPSSRRSSLKEEDPDEALRHLLAYHADGSSSSSSSNASAAATSSNGASKRRPSMAELLDDGSCGIGKLPVIPPVPPVTQVYRAETSSEQRAQQAQKAQTPSELLFGAMLRTCERNRREEELKKKKQLLMQYSAKKGADEDDVKCHLERLDLSFEDDDSEYDSEDDDDDSDVSAGPSASAKASKTAAATALNNSGCCRSVPSHSEQADFQQSFASATSMVFHQRTGLPLTSSPAPARKGQGRFGFDSSLTSPHDIKRALYDEQENRQQEQQLEKKMKAASSAAAIPVKPEPAVKPLQIRPATDDNCLTASEAPPKNLRKSKVSAARRILSASAPASCVHSSSNHLLGNFEESVLNGRLEPNSTVAGFTATIGASGAFQPQHLSVPVTVFFYSLGDNNNAVSSPYLGHINLGKKGYRVPPKGTIQVTLFNPLGTVVKMFVVMYDLSDMPANSKTFLRQRTLYMPSEEDANANYAGDEEAARKWLRYLIHLRFSSSKSGKLSLHTDIRMIIFRKSDLDTATDHTASKGFELRSFTTGPKNPKFSPKK